jgi:hypothetical protein
MGAIFVKEYAMQEWNCTNCNEYVHEYHPHYHNDQVVLCWSCAFIKDKINEKEFLKYCGIYAFNTRAAVNKDNDEIEVVIGREKFSWEKVDKDYRGTKQYTDWRKGVFDRDNYTCQRCNVRGGSLEAHHIKPFKDYFDLRYEQTNGITLCKKCHKETHKEMKNGN